MICPNCKAEIDDDSVFCTACGTKIENVANQEAKETAETAPEEEKQETAETAPEEEKQETAETTPEEEKQETAETAPEEEKQETAETAPEEEKQETAETAPETEKQDAAKKPFPKKAVIAVACVIALVLVLLLAGRSLLALVMPANTYYHYVEKKNMAQLVDTTVNVYDEFFLQNMDVLNTNASVNISLEVGDSALDLVEGLTYDATNGLVDGVDFLKQINLSMSSNTAEGAAEEVFKLALGKENILTLDTIVDTATEKLYFQIPELSKYYGQVEIPYSYGEYDDMYASADAAIKDVESVLPNSQEAKKILTKYLLMALDEMDNVDKDKAEFSVEGKKVKYTELTVKIDKKVLKDIIENVCTEMQTDKQLEDIVIASIDAANSNGLTNTDADQVWEEFCNELDYIASHAGLGLEKFQTVKMYVYVDKKGNIVGRKIRLGGNEVSTMLAKKGNKFEYKAMLDIDGAKLILSGTGKEINEVFNGDFKLSVSENDTYNFKFTVNDFDYAAAKKGKLKGGVSVNLGDAFGTLASIDSDFKAVRTLLKGYTVNTKLDIDSKKGKFEIQVLDGKDNFGTMAMNYALQKGTKINVPTKDCLDATNQDDVVTYLDSADFDGWIKKLKKAGVSADLTNEIEYYLDFVDILVEEML